MTIPTESNHVSDPGQFDKFWIVLRRSRKLHVNNPDGLLSLNFHAILLLMYSDIQKELSITPQQKERIQNGPPEYRFDSGAAPDPSR